jgi:virginiamycin B lyase
VTGADGNLWFTNSGASSVARVRPDGTGLTEFLTPTKDSFPRYIANGPNGSIWFTEEGGRNVARVDPGGHIDEWNVADPRVELVGIAAGADGNMWFCAASPSSSIGRITPTGTITFFKLPQPGAQARDIIAGPDGQLWYSDPGAKLIGRISTQGVFSAYPLPTNPKRVPIALTIGPDGAVWFTEGRGEADAIARLSPRAFGAPPAAIPSLSSTALTVFGVLLGVAGLRALR